MDAEIESRILTCGCSDTDKFAKEAFKLLFPDEKLPSIVHSMGIMRNETLRTVVNGLTEGNEKYAYYLTWTNDNVSAWDLIKGVQIQ